MGVFNEMGMTCHSYGGQQDVLTQAATAEKLTVERTFCIRALEFLDMNVNFEINGDDDDVI